MFGDRRPYPVALITLDEDEILPWAAGRGLPTDVPALAGHPDVHALVQDVLDAVNARHATAEQIKRFTILERDLSIDGGELTSSLKVKRAVVLSNHAEAVDALYA
jgi:long-chain acyl-CoA synthetase